MKCQSPSPKMEQGIGEFITGVVFLCALYIFAQNETVAGAVSAHINALGEGLKGLAARFGGTKRGSKSESRETSGPGESAGGKRKKKQQRGGAETDPPGETGLGEEGAGEGRGGWLAKLQGNWLLLSAAVLLLIVMAIGFGTNSRVGWITSTVLAVLILAVLSVVFVLSKIAAAEGAGEGEGLGGKFGRALAMLKQAGKVLGDYAAGVFALILTLSGMSLVVSGAGAFNQGCAQQTAG